MRRCIAHSPQPNRRSKNMTDDEFVQAESQFRNQVADFVKVCVEFGVDPESRIGDVVFDAIKEK